MTCQPSTSDLLPPKPPRSVLVETGKVSRRTLATLAGGAPVRGKVFKDETESGPRFTLTWPDADGAQLALTLDAPATREPLSEIARRLGPAAVRDLLAFMLICWAQRAKPRDPVWWWPEEHGAICDRRTPEGLEGVRRRFDLLSASELSARYPGEHKPVRGPVLAEVARYGEAVEYRLHPALWHGITRTDGTWGRRWWPLPVSLLKHRLGRRDELLPVLAIELGFAWRRVTPIGSPLRRRVDLLALALGLADATGRRRAGFARTAPERLRAALQAAEEHRVLAPGWRVEGGSLDSLRGHLIASPGASYTSDPKGEGHLPAWIPATGEELGRWMEGQGFSSALLAELLGVSPSTVRMWGKRYARGDELPPWYPLPASVRRTLRRRLWGREW